MRTIVCLIGLVSCFCNSFGASSPQVYTLPSRPVGFTNIILSGIVAPNEHFTEVWFEWGAGTNFDQATPTQFLSASVDREFVTATLPLFVPPQPYLYRVAASNAAGITFGRAQFINPGGHVLAAGGPNSINGEENNPPSEGFGEAAVSVGREHTIIMRQDGSVVGLGKMGLSIKRAATPPVMITNAIAAASGNEHALVLREDGSVVAWGVPNQGAPYFGRATNVPPTVTNIIAIAAGGENSLALHRDGTVIAWGGITNVPAAVTNVVMISSGWNVNAALRLDGAVVLWHNTTNYFFPSDSYVAVTAGENGGYLLRNDGRYYTVGLSTNLSLASPTNVAAIAFGQLSGVLLLNYDGLISGGNSLLSGRSNVVAVAQGWNFSGIRSALLRAQVSLPRAWLPVVDTIRSNSARFGGFVAPNGANAKAWFEWGEVNLAVTNSSVAADVFGAQPMLFLRQSVENLVPNTAYWCRLVISNAVGMETSWEQRFTTGAKLTVWGDANLLYNMPTHSANLVACEGGAARGIATDNGGNVFSWGNDSEAQVAAPSDLGEVANVGAGGWHSFALRADGTVEVWGGKTNLSGYSFAYLTNPPLAATNLVLAVGGGWHMVGLRADGVVIPWTGPSPSSEVGDVPASVMDIVSISTSGDHVLALRRDGRVFSWGATTLVFGHSVPNTLLSNVASIYASVQFNLAVRKDGTVAYWNGGQSYLVPGYTNVLAVAGGWNQHAALRRDGTVIATSTSGNSALPVPADLSDVTAIASGDYALFALGSDTTYITSHNRTSSGLINRDLTVILSGAEANGDPTFKRVTVLPDRGQLYQYTESGRGVAITSAGTIVDDLDGRLIFVPEAGEFGKPYTSFAFVTTDGVVESAPATNTINILPELVMTSSTTNVLAEGGFTLNFSAPTNVTCSVYFSTNLTTWILRGTATQVSPGEFRYKDTAASNDPYRFYRIRYQ